MHHLAVSCDRSVVAAARKAGAPAPTSDDIAAYTGALVKHVTDLHGMRVELEKVSVNKRQSDVD